MFPLIGKCSLNGPVSLTCLDFLSSGLSLSFLELVDRTAGPAADWFITSCAVSTDTWIQQRHTWGPNTSFPLSDVWVMEVKRWPSRCAAWRWARWADAAGVCGTIAPLWEPAERALASNAPDARPPARQTDARRTPRSPLTGQGCDVDMWSQVIDLYREIITHDEVWPVNSRTSVAHSTWRRTSVTGKCVTYSHSPNSSRTSTFCHWAPGHWGNTQS